MDGHQLNRLWSMSRRQNGQMGVFVLTVVPAFVLLLTFAADAAAIMAARSAADEFAVTVSRYIAADATQIACAVSDPECTGRNEQCAAGGIPWGHRYFDAQIVESYSIDAGDIGEVAVAGKAGFDDLIARLPASMALQELEVTMRDAEGSTPAGVRVQVTVRRENLLSEPLLGSARFSLVTGEAVSAMYVAESDVTSTLHRSPVEHVCGPSQP